MKKKNYNNTTPKMECNSKKKISSMIIYKHISILYLIIYIYKKVDKQCKSVKKMKTKN